MLRSSLRAAARFLTMAGMLLATVALASPASAETVRFSDAKGDMGNPADIYRVRVTNDTLVKVRIKHDDLRPNGNADASVFVDTDFSRPGPEFVFSTGLFVGTDYSLRRADGWQVVGAGLTCSHSLRLDYDLDVSVFRMSRACLGNPDAVRIAVRVTASSSAGATRDWLGGYRQWTPRVQHN